MSLAVIDYGSGNVRSVVRAAAAAARVAGRASAVELTDDPDRIAIAERLILPGVGHFADCAAGLRERPGLLEAMEHAVLRRGAPFLGVCVGMQLLADVGREDIETRGLGWIAGSVDRLTPSDAALPLPHMGWNTLGDLRPHPVLEGLDSDAHVYFVHSYGFTAAHGNHVLATADYGGVFPAVIGRDAIVGVQFHPEKSQAAGQRLLANFLAWSI